MVNVSINGTESKDLGFILAKVSLGALSPRVNTITIPGMNGVLDLSTSIDGKLHYDNREIEITLRDMHTADDEWAQTFLNLEATVGYKCVVVFDTNPDQYFIGTATLSEYDGLSHKRDAVIKLSADPHIYRYPIFDVDPTTGMLSYTVPDDTYPSFILEDSDLIVYQDDTEELAYSLDFASFTVNVNELEAEWS